MKPFHHAIAWLCIAAFLAAGLGACSTPTVPAIPTSTQPAPEDVLISSKPRQLPAAPQEDIDALVQGNTAFAIDLYDQLKESSSNLFFSPYSISLALAMTYAGAKGSTAEQMAQVLHFDLPPEQLHPAFNALDQSLTRPTESEPVPTEQGTSATPFQLNIANSLWGQRDYPFLPQFLDMLALNYGAGLRPMNFSGEPEESRQIINQWVEQQTQEKIKDLLPPGKITTDTRLVLTNAIYFYGAWLHKFEERKTTPAPFTLLNGSTVEAEQMRIDEVFGYYQGDGFQVVQLPYDTRPVAMTIFLPDEGQFEAFQSQLDAAQLAAILPAVKPQGLALGMPKFKFEAFTDLSGTLQEMGMVDAFQNADFSGMTGTPELRIDAVVHKAYVGVNEEGTEAAAATAVVMAETALITNQELTIDRPFIFIIHDLETGTILFMGQVLNPVE